jgi:hypothetical protein
MDQINIVVKNWPNDLHANCKPNSNFKQCLKSKESLVEKNYNLIKKHNIFEELELMVINFVRLGWICVLCEVWMGSGACKNLGFNSLTSYFDFV